MIIEFAFKTFSEKYTKIQLMLIILTRKKIKINKMNQQLLSYLV